MNCGLFSSLYYKAEYQETLILARPREFNEEIALQGAMDVFWMHGYEGASLPELLDGMGITRGSLYKAFTDKKTLFMNVLERYEQEAVEPAVNLLTSDAIKDGRLRIEKLFMIILESVENNDHKGCLLCSAAAGPAHKDEQIAKSVHQLLGKMKSAFELALKQSKAHQKLDSEKRSQLADLLITQYIGLRILSRSQASVVTIKRSISSLMILLSAK